MFISRLISLAKHPHSKLLVDLYPKCHCEKLPKVRLVRMEGIRDNKCELKVLTSVYCFWIRVMWRILGCAITVEISFRFSCFRYPKEPQVVSLNAGLPLICFAIWKHQEFPILVKLSCPVAHAYATFAWVFKRIIVK